MLWNKRAALLLISLTSGRLIYVDDAGFAASFAVQRGLRPTASNRKATIRAPCSARSTGDGGASPLGSAIPSMRNCPNSYPATATGFKSIPREHLKRLALLILIFCGSNQASAAETSDLSAHDIAKLLQNPLADTISVPFANDTNFPLGPNRQAGNVLNIQPVIPFRVNSDWNLVTRTTVPLVSQPRLSSSDPAAFGLGDIVPMAVLSPSAPSNVTWGLGATFSVPTATNNSLGANRWAAGPAAVVLTMPDPWVFGLLASHLRSFAGSSSGARIDRTAVQYFVIYNFSSGWFLSSTPIITADWAAKSSNRWTIPVGAEIGKVFNLSGQAMSASVGLYRNVIRPTDSPDWQVRLNVSFVFPR